MKKGQPLNKRPKAKKGTLGRVLRFVTKYYKGALVVVVICLLVSAMVNSVGGLFTNKFTEYIEEGLDIFEIYGKDTALAQIMPKVTTTIILLVCIYLTGLICNFTWTRIMAYVTQGTLRNMRNTMFETMQKLPIKYFDTHPHGDEMSHYTNVIDTLRQLISQSIPSLISSGMILLSLLFIMLYFSVWLTLVVLAGGCLMLFVTKTIGGRSAHYFIRQQKSLGHEEGYIE